MLLQYLIQNLTTNEVIGTTNIEIGKIEYDSKKVNEKDVFVVIKGYSQDGNDYIIEAIDNGAIALIIESDVDLSNYSTENMTIIKVENARIALAKMAETYYDYPAKKLKVIGITGTKGKTTTAYMIRDIMNASGKKTGMIGTIYNTYGKVQIESTRTSPESLELQKLLKDMVDAGMEYVVMEVSSHALTLDRVYGILLDYYPSELLDRAFKPYWRIPSEDLLNKKNNHNPYHEELINYCFNTPTIMTWFYKESKCQLAQRPEIIDVVKNYKDANKKRPTATDFENSISTKRQAEVNLGSVPQAFAPKDTSRKSGEAYPTTE